MQISCHGYVLLDAYCCHFFAFFLHSSPILIPYIVGYSMLERLSKLKLSLPRQRSWQIREVLNALKFIKSIYCLTRTLSSC